MTSEAGTTAGVIAVDGQLCMEGVQLVRHHLQQARLHADFLPGGESFDTVVSEHVITPEEAATEVRADLDAALDAIEALL